MKKTILTLLLNCLLLQVFGRDVRGVVIDKASRQPIETAVVTDGTSQHIAITDDNGIFQLNDIHGDSIYVTILGYKPMIAIVDDNKKITVALERGQLTLKEVTISNSPSFKTYAALSQLDLNMEPIRSAQDLLRLVPGLFIAQHQGGGKAEQIFLRGFDADHGTDVNISVDGIPVNMVSHAHGQGYADLHFLIPELVAGYDFGKGPYYTDKGDFTTAGFVAYNTLAAPTQNMVKVEAGQFNTFRLMTMLTLLGDRARKKGMNAYVAGEQLYSNGGPFIMPEHFRRYNLFGKFNARLGGKSKFTFMASTMGSTWKAAGEIPDRAVQEGYIPNRWGALDTAQGGYTTRTNVSAKLTTDVGNGWTMDNQLWYSHYLMSLISNFTFYYYFPTTGDEFRQYDNRDVAGYNWKLSKTKNVNGVLFTTTLGAGSRYDNIHPVELDHTENGQFLSYLQYGKAHELNTNGYADETIRMGKWLFDAGLRLDYFHFSYQNLAPTGDSFANGIFTQPTQTADKIIACPKLSAAYNFNSSFQLYLKAGKGFHSNDARVAVSNEGFETLPAAYGSDLGVNWKPTPKLYINSALWYLYLQQEFTFGQDLINQPGGPITPSGRTARMGIDFSGRYELRPWLFANVNVNFAHPRYIDSATGHNYVPLAPTLTSTAGLFCKLRNGFSGGISYRYLHNRAANSDYSLTARGYFVTDLTANYRHKWYELGVAIENLFNVQWDESQFEYTSRLYNEKTPVDQVSYTPGVPFFAKGMVTVFF